MNTKLAIFDLDNCLANDEWRIPHIRFELDNKLDEKWDKYHSLCGNDVPANNEWLNGARARGLTPVFVTMRPVKYWDQTVEWIERRLGLAPGTFALYMRPEGDHRGSVELKREIVTNLLANVSEAYDDRPDIIYMYRSLGINAYVLKIHNIDPHTGKEAIPDAPPTRGEPPCHKYGPNPGCKCGATCARDATPLDVVAFQTLHAPPGTYPFTTDPVAAFAKTTGGDRDGPNAGEYLAEAALMYERKNAEYGADYRHFGAVAAGLFPNGLTVRTPQEWGRLAVFIWTLSKMGRYAKNMQSGGHADSALDMSVYAAMLRELTE